MTVVNVSSPGRYELPPTLRTAQEAIALPEVQEMLRKLSAYRLGIFMPHKHDDATGEFLPLPAEVMQVESALAMSFEHMGKIAARTERFLPVAWLWRAGAPTVASACEMVSDDGPGDEEQKVKHEKFDESQSRCPAALESLSSM